MAKSTSELDRKIIESTARLLAMGLDEDTIMETIEWQSTHTGFSLDVGSGGIVRETQIKREISKLTDLLEKKGLNLKAKEDKPDFISDFIIEARKHLPEAIKQVKQLLPPTPDEIKRRKVLPLTPEEAKKAAFARKPLPFTPLELTDQVVLNAILTLTRKKLSKEAIMKSVVGMVNAEKLGKDTFELGTTKVTADIYIKDEEEPTATEDVLIIRGNRIKISPEKMIPILEAFEKLTRFLKNNGPDALSKILAKAEKEHLVAFRSMPPLPPVPQQKKLRERAAKLAPTMPVGGATATSVPGSKEGPSRSKVTEMAKQYTQKIEAQKAAKKDKNKKDGKDADKKSGQRPGTPGVGG